MKQEIEKSNFSLLNQSGPFRINEDVEGESSRFGRGVKAWVKELKSEPGNLTKYLAIRNQLLTLSGTSSISEIKRTIKNSNPEECEQNNSSAHEFYRLLGGMYGLDENETRTRIEEYAKVADRTVDYLTSKILSPYTTIVEMTNEITAINNPQLLLHIVFDERYDKRTRFEAKRKLILMNLAATIDHRERETKVREKFTKFLYFLDNYLWSPHRKIGQVDNVYLLSKHDKESFKCTSVEVLQEKRKLQPLEIITPIGRRSFMAGEKEIPIYVTTREKSIEARILKLLRKGQENPAVAVDDELGLMGVLNSEKDVRRFTSFLGKSAANAGSSMLLEEVSDTLKNGSKEAINQHSSPSLKMLKFFARIEGMRIEVVLHTNETFIDYQCQKNVSHDEYEIRRLFDSGVIELLFPLELYGMNHDEARRIALKDARKRIEESKPINFD